VIKLLVVDDHIIFREGIKKVLGTAFDIKVTGEAGSGKEALMALGHSQYSVIIQSLSLPDMEGLDLLCRIKKQQPDVPVLVLSFFPEEQYAVRALKEGAAGYLPKESVPKDLIHAIRKAAVGRKYISTTLAEILANSVSGREDKHPHETLSGREFQVFSLISAGKSVKEMACELSLARTTITSYRTRIFDKLNFKTNADLIRYAVENQIN
jgi:DNA-binding NarL/FixJ family response regulator